MYRTSLLEGTARMRNTGQLAGRIGPPLVAVVVACLPSIALADATDCVPNVVVSVPGLTVTASAPAPPSIPVVSPAAGGPRTLPPPVPAAPPQPAPTLQGIPAAPGGSTAPQTAPPPNIGTRDATTSPVTQAAIIPQTTG